MDAVRLLKLRRLDYNPPSHLVHRPGDAWVPASGVLPMASMEIAQLDNDPSFPENGKLELILRGGL